MACLFGHKWDGCKCAKCGKTRNEGHDWDLCKGLCKRCGATQSKQHDWDLCKGLCKRCGATQFEQHDWDGCKCTRCGKTRTISSPKNLVVVALRPVEGEIEGNEGAIINAAASLADYATNNEFMLSPTFSNLYKKYASLRGVDHIIFGSNVDTHGDIVAWIASQTGENEKQIESLAWSRFFEMSGWKSIGDGVRMRFCVASYFYLP